MTELGRAIRDLRGARVWIERGWCQGQLGNGLGGVCLSHAVASAIEGVNSPLGHVRGADLRSTPERERFDKACGALRFTLHLHRDAHCYSLRDWNDVKGRTKADVLQLIDWTLQRLQDERKRERAREIMRELSDGVAGTEAAF